MTCTLENGVINATARVRREGGRWTVELALPAWIAKEMYAESNGKIEMFGMWLAPGAAYSFMEMTDHIDLSFRSERAGRAARTADRAEGDRA